MVIVEVGSMTLKVFVEDQLLTPINWGKREKSFEPLDNAQHTPLVV